MVHAAVTGGLAGLLSLAHCAAMCGPLSALACRGRSGRPGLRYQTGRIAGYAFAGSLAARVGQVLETPRWSVSPTLLSLAGAAALAALALSTLWANRPRPALVQLRAPRARRALGALASIVPREPLAYGVLSVLLPCGALAAALLIAAGTASPLEGSLTMASFAVVSGVGVLAGGALLSRVAGLRGRFASRAAVAALVAAALLLAAQPLYRAHAAGSSTDTAPTGGSCH